jgi:hypothetical protein
MTTERLTIDLPDELLKILGWPEEKIAAKTREALVMTLLREHKLYEHLR